MYSLRLFYTLFTTITVIIVVCSSKSMCIPSFVLIGCCVSAIYVPIVMYGLRLFIVVLQESFIALHFPVSELAKCIA